MVESIVIFKDDDLGYLYWLDSNPGGYVVNCHRNPTQDYLKLHRANCYSISGVPSKGKWWTNQYIKVCSMDKNALADWAMTRVGGEIQPCSHCM